MSTERRLHAPRLPEAGQEVRLSGESARHAGVLRLRVGDAVTLFDGEGGLARGTITTSARDELVVRVDSTSRDDAPRTGVTLVQCLPRGGKLDDLVRAATELGVDAIRLARSEHAVGRADDERWERRRERLERVIREAARQSERERLPALVAPADLASQADGFLDGVTKLVFCGRTGVPLSALPKDAPVVVVVGPEGGLSERDLETLAERGFRAVSLGGTVLRVETAVVAALAAVAQARRDGAEREEDVSSR